MNDSFYRDYEDIHRGSRELIKTRLQAYLPFITPLTALFQPASAVDLGCGRGEWLELLGEAGFEALGVDLDEGMLAACRERGLTARQADALSTLREMPDSTASVVSAFHVVEHLPFADVRMLIDEALRVLKPGGLLILETPNPENLVVGASSFYQDPSHERPIPSELLRFAVEHAGFERAKILRLQEARELHSASEVRLINVLSGVSPDYGVVAQKVAAPEVLAKFDSPFDAHYGISLEALARHYDEDAAKRITGTKHLIAEAEGRLAHALQNGSDRLTEVKHRLLEAEARTEARLAQMEARISQLDAMATDAEARAAQANATVQSMLLSRSWRITAPMRYAGTTARQLKSAIKEGRVVSGCKQHAKSALRLIGQMILRRPGLTRAVFAILDHVPGLKYRLRDIMRAPTGVPHAAHMPPASPSQLSPRTASIYAELKKVMDARKN
ncbi:class I SAM-dependent methyltransferase [Noviherbaspirillum sp.]|jgi:O-antigen chain-terminating methyltransferase|uniref:class I SAM-dependent methyltransferase n=1 Tax=Noviherbaspirillum sp. TaxID=1926288 RepID=UPI0025D0F38B|nr:class I SAM-dependent methyltransferase [Noviherbaspirillum sp.]